jgi:ABC-type uncharacterized transport system permease subunit
MEIITTWISIILSASIVGLITAIWFKRKRAMRNLTPRLDDGPIIGTAADLERAEKARALIPDQRVELLKTHVLLHRFSTLQGYTETFMASLVKSLSDSGIASDTFFQETLAPGVGDALLRQGVFELYVDREQLDEAATIIRAKLTE